MAAETEKIILVVDDEELFRSSVAEALAVRGTLSVMTASDGAQALQVLRCQPVDLLITDLHMPVLGGFELLKEFMRVQPGKPALVLTAHGSPEVEANLRLLGDVWYLEKPIDLRALHMRIDEALRPRTRGHIEGITLFGFLQLLEIERKTCTLTLRLGERRAILGIRAGELVHAEADGMTGDQAVLRLGGWEAPEIDIEHVCRTAQRTVQGQLTELLMEAARLADESRRDSRERPAAPRLHPPPADASPPRGPALAETSPAAMAVATGAPPRALPLPCQWWSQVDPLGGIALPSYALAIRIPDGTIQVLRGTAEDGAAWSPVCLDLLAQAMDFAGHAATGACEYVGERLFVGLLWQDGDALVVASALPEPAAASWFHLQFATLTRMVHALEPGEEGS